jgi:hypothetical protein
MKRQTKHVVFGLLFTIMAGAGVVAQAQQPCPVDCPPKPICAPVVEAPKPVEVVCAPQPVCAPVVEAPKPVEVVCAPQPVCAPVVQAPQPVVVTYTKQTGILTGTYRLDPSRSDDPKAALSRVSLGATDCACQPQQLASPETLAIDHNGQCVIIASSFGKPVSLTADGKLHPDTIGSSSTQSTFQGDALFIRTYNEDECLRNYTVTFTPFDNCLRVTRYINTGDPNNPLVINTVYTKTSDVAQLNLYEGATIAPTQVVYSGNFLVPNGANLGATLNESLDASQLKEGDRFTMNVISPSEYSGAVIEGFISDISPARTAFNFERIRLSDGRVYDFAGEIVSVSTADGTAVQVSSGTLIDESQRQAQENLVRTSDSAAIAHVVGLVPVSGSGAGINTVFIPGSGTMRLGSGTEIVIRAASPRTI